MIRRLGAAAGLALMWVALWGHITTGTVIAGVAAGLAVALLVPLPHTDRHMVLRPLEALRFIGLFGWLLAASTWSVVRLVLSARAASAYGVMIEAELAPASYPVRTLIAHSISLTPGTLTVDVDADGRTLTVHVMDADAVIDARRSIARLERHACAAFSPLHPHHPSDPSVAESR